MSTIDTAAMQGAIFSDPNELRKKIESDPSYIRLNESLRDMEREKREVDTVLVMPHRDRIQHMRDYNTDLYNAIGFREFRKEKDMALIYGFALSGLIVAGGVAAVLAGILPSCLASVIGFFGAVSGPGGALAYIKASKKWILPRQIDGLYVRELKGRKANLETGLKDARERKEIIEKNLAEKVLKDEVEVQRQEAILRELNKKTIFDDDQGDFVSVAGIKLPKNQLMKYNIAFPMDSAALAANAKKWET